MKDEKNKTQSKQTMSEQTMSEQIISEQTISEQEQHKDIKNLKNRVRILEEQIALILEKMVKL